jgi:hypothetical protein
MDQSKLSQVAVRLRIWLNGRNFLSFVLLPLLFLLFLGPLQVLASATLVKYVFSGIRSNMRSDLIFIFYAIFLIIIFLTRFIHYVVSYQITFFLLIITGIYVYYRNYSTVWIFIPFTPAFQYFNFSNNPALGMETDTGLVANARAVWVNSPAPFYHGETPKLKYDCSCTEVYYFQQLYL